jgi:hypothetical protein
VVTRRNEEKKPGARVFCVARHYFDKPGGFVEDGRFAALHIHCSSGSA